MKWMQGAGRAWRAAETSCCCCQRRRKEIAGGARSWDQETPGLAFCFLSREDREAAGVLWFPKFYILFHDCHLWFLAFLELSPHEFQWIGWWPGPLGLCAASLWSGEGRHCWGGRAVLAGLHFQPFDPFVRVIVDNPRRKKWHLDIHLQERKKNPKQLNVQPSPSCCNLPSGWMPVAAKFRSTTRRSCAWNTLAGRLWRSRSRCHWLPLAFWDVPLAWTHSTT